MNINPAKLNQAIKCIVPQVIDARKDHQEKKEVINTLSVNLLKEMGVKTEEGIPIISAEKAYRMDDIYENEFFKKLNILSLEKYPETEVDLCPALVAETYLRSLNKKLVEACQPLTGVSHDAITLKLDNYKKYIDYLVGFYISYNK